MYAKVQAGGNQSLVCSQGDQQLLQNIQTCCDNCGHVIQKYKSMQPQSLSLMRGDSDSAAHLTKHKSMVLCMCSHTPQCFHSWHESIFLLPSGAVCVVLLSSQTPPVTFVQAHLYLFLSSETSETSRQAETIFFLSVTIKGESVIRSWQMGTFQLQLLLFIFSILYNVFSSFITLCENPGKAAAWRHTEVLL